MCASKRARYIALPGLLLTLLGCGEAEMSLATTNASLDRDDTSEPSFATTSEPVPTAVWENVISEPSPPARDQHRLVYDSVRKKVVLFGGWGGTYLNDLWEWDGNAWTHVTPQPESPIPTARHGHGLVYDGTRRKVVLFGGVTGLTVNDIWEWDGSTWTDVTPKPEEPNPLPRDYAEVAYDSARGKVVLFGGFWAANALDDTWEWDGEKWTEMALSVRPPGRLAHALAYDGARNKVVLFGGQNGPEFDDTWEWDGTTWTKMTPPTSPPARWGHALTYDSARKKVILFGGKAQFADLDDTWEWDGSTWTQVTPTTNPSGRWDHAATYDAERGRVVVFGGASGFGTRHGDTWELQVYGNPCSSDAECNTGHCVDGVCCQTACGGDNPDDCQVCSAAAGAEKDGVCGTVADGTTCQDGSTCTDGDTCHAGTCVGSAITCPDRGACEEPVGCHPDEGCVYQPKETGTACRAASCEDGKESPVATCDGTSPTCPEPTVVECGLYVCGDDACLSSCTRDDDCAEGAVCIASSCVIDEGGTDGGEEADAGADEADSGSGGDDAGSDTEPGGGAAAGSAEAEDGGCSCRAAGGTSKSRYAAWVASALALAVWRRSRKPRVDIAA